MSDSPEVRQNQYLIDRLLQDARLYTTGKDYLDLLKFIVRLRNLAPFNAMLLHIQKPGLTYATSAKDWRDLFGRYPKEGARPLLILWAFGPVALVYDIQDTEGTALPLDAFSFPAVGPVGKADVAQALNGLSRKGIDTIWVDAGDGKAGQITRLSWSKDSKLPSQYRVQLNQNHHPPVHLATLAHELGHLALGHLGEDTYLKVPDRRSAGHRMEELEAESVSYIVCGRHGVETRSLTYLAPFLAGGESASIDVYRVSRAAGLVETWLGLAPKLGMDPAGRLR